MKAIDSTLERLYDGWLAKTGDANAAATLTAAQVQAARQSGEAGNSLLNLNEAGKYLGYNPAGLRKLVAQQKIQYTQNGRGPIRFRREWLDEFIASNAGGPQDIERSPAQRRMTPVSSVPAHGFDPALFHAESHKGAA